MKKIGKLGIIGVSVAMMLSMAACGDDKDNGSKDTTTEVSTEAAVEVADSLEILTTVWGTYGENEIFAIAGG